MPRYYRRRATRVVKPKKKWATNIRELINNVTSTNGMDYAGLFIPLCVNANETSDEGAVAPTPVVLKTGNYKVQCDVLVGTTAAAVVNIVAYVMYIPEGVFEPGVRDPVGDFTKLNNIVKRHPEWIITWKQCGFDQVGNNANLERVTFSSRLKRNLNSGDQVYFFLLARVQVEDPAPGKITKLYVNGMTQFWTCAN